MARFFLSSGIGSYAAFWMSRRRPAYCRPWPWHEKQFCDRIGRTSQFQFGWSGMGALPASGALLATLSVTWPLWSWADTRRVPAVTAMMLAPIVRLDEPILRMEANLYSYGQPLIPTEKLSALKSLATSSASLMRRVNRKRCAVATCRDGRHRLDACAGATQAPPSAIEPSKSLRPRRFSETRGCGQSPAKAFPPPFSFGGLASIRPAGLRSVNHKTIPLKGGTVPI